MANGFDFDVAVLLEPFDGPAPAGVDPREDASAQSIYYRLRDARSEARDAERRADGETAEAGTSVQQWRSVRDLAARLLRDRAKDLEAAAWLTEALVRESSFAGLTAGSAVIGGLAEAFWDGGLFPAADEDGVATTVAPVAGLNGLSGDGTLAQALRKATMFARPDGAELTFWQYAQAEDVEGIGDAARKKARLAAGVPVFTSLETEARAAGPAHFAALRDAIEGAIAGWDQMSRILDARAGSAAPSTGRVRELLTTLLSQVQRYAPPRSEIPPPKDPEAGPIDAAAVEGNNAPAVITARPVTREAMLGELARIADYFRESEPQSPLSLTLDEAIRRARLTWPELLEEVVSDEQARNTMLVQLGIRPRKQAPG